MNDLLFGCVLILFLFYAAADIWWERRCRAAVDRWNNHPEDHPDDPFKAQMY